MRSKKIIKIISLILAVSFAFISLVSCSQSNVSTRKVDEKGRKVLTFMCANISESDEGVFKVAIEKFQKENPNVVVDIKDLSKMGYDTSKYINLINTELMAGKGPDIIPISYLSTIKYYKKNIFADLNEFINKDKSFDKEKYLGNVIKASEYNGKLFAMPVYFSFPAVIGSKELLDEEGINIDSKVWTTNDFISIAKKVNKDTNGDGVVDVYALPQIPMEAITKLFISMENFIDYENRKASFDSPQFIELLKLLKSISDNKLAHKKIKMGEIIPYKNSKETVFSGGTLEGYRGVLSMKYCLGGGERVLYRLPSLEKSNGISFDSRMMLTINNSSEYKEQAWEFLKVLLSEDIQAEFANISSTSGFPISVEALDKQKRNISNLDWRVKDDSAGWIPITFSIDELEFIDESIKEINSYRNSEIRVEDIVIDEIGALFSKGFSFNNKNAEEIAKNIQKKVQLYLNE